jgi:hypothetical protein
VTELLVCTVYLIMNTLKCKSREITFQSIIRSLLIHFSQRIITEFGFRQNKASANKGLEIVKCDFFVKDVKNALKGADIARNKNYHLSEFSQFSL